LTVGCLFVTERHHAVHWEVTCEMSKQKKVTQDRLQSEALRFCKGNKTSFGSDRELLAKAHLFLRLRHARHEANEAPLRRVLTRLERQVQRRLHELLARSDRPRLAREFQSRRFTQLEREIVLALACSALGISDRIYDAEGLVSTLRMRGADSLRVLRALAPNRRLAKSGLVSIARDEVPLDHGVRLENKLLRSLVEPVTSKKPVDEQQQRACKRVIKPRLKLRDLVLPDRVAEALRLALTQAGQGQTLFSDWGLGRVFPYGRAMTLLFSGTPGVGKTAAAEALAGELGKGLLVTHYPELVSCWIGETEKALASVFRDARKADAVLFWDEADSLFYERTDYSRTWEVSTVNTLLKEVEQFEGVCILATNRPVMLDKALHRRIAVKVEFKRPDAAMREKLWHKLLPKRLPLANDVRIKQLSTSDLSGGEIKNVVLNAARLALTRNAKGPVCMADFQAALRLEKAGVAGETPKEKLGFRCE